MVMAKEVKKVSITEQDVAALVEKYETTTVLTLLQEVANYPHCKINWNEFVRNSKTGISSARECQMLWRHLAYGHPLLDHHDFDFDPDALPLDDDSDIECEREAIPHVTNETKLEADACVKVMIDSHLKNQHPHTSSVITAPMHIVVPDLGSYRNPCSSMQENKVIFPVTIERKIRPHIPASSRAEKAGTSSTSSTTSTEKKRSHAQMKRI